MIDYDKLKLAHELCRKLDDYWFSIEFCINIKEHDRINIFLYQCDANSPITFINIDDLINKLQELTRPKNRFVVGQEVWFLDRNSIESIIIDRSSIDGELLWSKGFSIYSNNVYRSEIEVIEAQIKYWSDLKYQTVDSPKSESNDCYCGQIANDGVSIIKCGYCPQELCDHKFHYGVCIKCNAHID